MTDSLHDDFDPALDALLRLPRLSPRPDFADQVMARVAIAPARVARAAQVVVPPRPIWDAKRNAVIVPPAVAAPVPPRKLPSWIPASRPVRYAAGFLVATASVTVTALTTLALTRLDLVTLVGSMAFERLQAGFGVWGAQLATAVFGESAVGYMSAVGSPEGALTVAGFAAGAYATLAGLRSAAAATTTNRV